MVFCIVKIKGLTHSIQYQKFATYPASARAYPLVQVAMNTTLSPAISGLVVTFTMRCRGLVCGDWRRCDVNLDLPRTSTRVERKGRAPAHPFFFLGNDRLSISWRDDASLKARTINTSRKATGGLPYRQTPFVPHTNRYDPLKPLLTP